MKSLLKYLLILVVLLPLAGPLKGQEVRPEGSVSLDLNGVPLREVLDEIASQTAYTFSYSNRQVDDSQPVSIHVVRQPLAPVLDSLLLPRQISYRLVEKQIVLRKARKGDPDTAVGKAANKPGEGFTFCGYVKDRSSSEILIGAAVWVPGTNSGTITNNYGFFSLTLETSPDTLHCSFIGYRKEVLVHPESGKGNLDFLLEKEPELLSEVKIVTPDPKFMLESVQGSADRVRASSVRRMPAVMGEKDVIKSLALIPGIKFFGDGSTIFYVRGGNRDQNLVTIDEAPVYNPTHMLGFFSTIVPEAIKDIQVYKGDFPASYGGRLSSLIDIRTRDGNMNRFGMEASTGLLASTLTVEGPLWKEHISYFISGRRSYILKPIQKFNENIRDLYFSDLHFKLNYDINRRNRVFFSVYSGKDNFIQQNTSLHSSGINWQNATSTIRWNHLFSDRLFANFTLYAGRYDYYLNTWQERRNYWNSHIDNVSLKADFTWYRKPGSTLRYGIRVAEHFFNPGNYYEGGQLYDLPFEISPRQTHETALYISDQIVRSDRFSLSGGLRLSVWQNLGSAVEYRFNEQYVPVDSVHYGAGVIYHSYATLDPRLSMAFRLSQNGILKLGYSVNSQFEHLLTNSVSPFTSLEVWLPSGPNVEPQRAGQLSVAYTLNDREDRWSLETELYYKKMTHLIDYVDHAEMLLNPAVEGELRFGSGKAWGLEILLSRKSGKVHGWLSYTYSRAIYTVPGINEGHPYPAYSDRPHDLAVFMTWDLSERLSLNSSFIYMTGAPFTSPSGFYYYQNHEVPLYLERNNDRLPDYHRLDLALNWRLNRREQRFTHELVFSVYNLYGRKNPVLIHFNKTEDENGKLLIPWNYYESPELVASQYYIFGTIPSMSYHFSF